MSALDDFEKLRRYAKRRHEIGVRYVDLRKGSARSQHVQGCVAWYDLDSRKIYVSRSLRKRPHTLVYTLAHELGHAMDFDGMTRKQFRTYRKMCGISHYFMRTGMGVKRRHGKIIREFVLQNEKIAFDNGELILDHLKIKIPRWKMDADRASTMYAYEQILSFSSR